MSQEIPPPDFPPVSEEESGQKMLQFLQRRLDLPSSLLHRWLRTGQIRLNGCRVRPFDRLKSGDVVRLPPFAGGLAENAPPDDEENFTPLEIVGEKDGILAVFKPAGLAVHGGSGIGGDHLLARLQRQLGPRPFGPVPAHRLDRSTSGILLCALSYEALAKLQAAFRARASIKEYLAWVEGPLEEEKILVSRLRKQGPKGHEKMRVVPSGKKSLCVARPLAVYPDATLAHLRLITGRTHQIRAQMAEIGHPLYGDVKYGAERHSQGLLLHAFRITLPDGTVFSAPPPWTGGFAPAQLPDVFEIDPVLRKNIDAALAGA